MCDDFEDSGSEETIDELSWQKNIGALEKEGYRNGLEVGQEESLQKGFDTGFKQSSQLLFQLAALRGRIGGKLTYNLMKPGFLSTPHQRALEDLLADVVELESEFLHFKPQRLNKVSQDLSDSIQTIQGVTIDSQINIDATNQRTDPDAKLTENKLNYNSNLTESFSSCTELTSTTATDQNVNISASGSNNFEQKVLNLKEEPVVELEGLKVSESKEDKGVHSTEQKLVYLTKIKSCSVDKTGREDELTVQGLSQNKSLDNKSVTGTSIDSKLNDETMDELRISSHDNNNVPQDCAGQENAFVEVHQTSEYRKFQDLCANFNTLMRQIQNVN